MKKNNFSAFTLIEMLAGVALITIISFGMLRLSFTPESQNENKLKIEGLKIIQLLEAARSNALLGRTNSGVIDTDLQWVVEISPQSNRIEVYSEGSSGRRLFDSYSSTNGFSIRHVQCLSIDAVESTNISSSTVSLSYDGRNSEILTDCPDVNKEAKLYINVGNANTNQDIEVNSVTGVITSL